jgi:hypothetical protein
MIDEKILEKLRLVRAANPDMSYDEAWNIATSKRTAIPGDMGAATRAVQAENPGMDFETAWDLVEAEALPHLRKNETVGMALIRARQQKTLGPSSSRGAELPALDFDQVEAIEWQPGKRLLIRGSEAVFVD